MTTKTAEHDQAREQKPVEDREAPRWARALRFVLAERVALLSVLLVVVVAWFWYLGQNDYLVAPYDADYLASALETMVPLCLLGLAEFIVIVSGRSATRTSMSSKVAVPAISMRRSSSAAA